MNSNDVTKRLELVREFAGKLGFCAAGVTTADPLDDEYVARYRRWLESGAAGDLNYMAGDIEKRFHPREIFPQAQSVIVLAMSFAPRENPESSVGIFSKNRISGCHAHASWACTPQNKDKHAHPSCGHGTDLNAQSQESHKAISESNRAEGYVCIYARGRDYHKVLKKRAEKLCSQMRESLGEFDYKICVDTAPVAERSLAVRAGLGFVGKNSLLIVPGYGSMVVLCEIFCSLDIFSTPQNVNLSCGTCRKCVNACPTSALDGCGGLDASRCISSLTIEHGSEIPMEIAAKMDNKIFGCDDCMIVCPYNSAVAPGDDELRNDDFASPKITDVLHWTQDDWDSFTQGHATRRAKLAQFIRNAEIATQNEIKK